MSSSLRSALSLAVVAVAALLLFLFQPWKSGASRIVETPVQFKNYPSDDTLRRELEAARITIATLRTDLADSQATIQRLRANEPAPEPLIASAPPLEGIPVADFRRMQTARRLAAIDPLYGPYFTRSALTQEQIGQLKALMAEAEDRQADIAMAARELAAATGQPVTAEAVAEQRRKVEAEEQAKIEAFLGKEEYARFHEYAQTARLRQVTNELASALFFSSEPLSSEKAEAVHQILSRSDKGQVRSLNAIDWDRVLKQAEAVLTPDQLSELLKIQQRQAADREWYQTLSRVNQRR